MHGVDAKREAICVDPTPLLVPCLVHQVHLSMTHVKGPVEGIFYRRKRRISIIRLSSFSLIFMTKLPLASSFVVRHANILLARPTSRKLTTKEQQDDLLMTRNAQVTSSSAATAFSALFDLTLPEGRCVGLSFTEPLGSLNELLSNTHKLNRHWMHSSLHQEEVAYARNLHAVPSNQASFVLGRLAMRTILDGELDGDSDYVLLKDKYGRPTLPAGYLGSISHKKATAVALVAKRDPATNTGVGIDLEYANDSKAKIAPRVLTPYELTTIGNVQVSASLVLKYGDVDFACRHPRLSAFIRQTLSVVDFYSSGRFCGGRGTASLLHQRKSV
jgi:hypothetical protein